MNDIKIVWFDFGGVLSPPIEYLFDQYAVKTGLSPSILQQAMQDVAGKMNMPMLAPIENAILSEVEWGKCLEICLKERNENVDLSHANLRQFGAQWFSNVRANDIMVDALKRIKDSGYKTGILTNNVAEWEPHWQAMLSLGGSVDLVVDSSKEKCRKPDPSFFNAALRSCGLDHHECVLIDDALENIESAKTLGWKVVHFRTNFEALKQLQEITGVKLIGARKEGAV